MKNHESDKKIKKLLNRWEQESYRQPMDVADGEKRKKTKPGMEEYLVSQYDFRFNVLTGITEYRKKAEAFRTLLADRGVPSVQVLFSGASRLGR